MKSTKERMSFFEEIIMPGRKYRNHGGKMEIYKKFTPLFSAHKYDGTKFNSIQVYFSKTNTKSPNQNNQM